MSYADASTYFPQPQSLPWQVLDFFTSCPEEELTSEDVAYKFDASRSGSISQKMAPLVRMQLLDAKRVGRVLHYTAGPLLEQWAVKNLNADPPAKEQKAPKQKPIKINVTLLVHQPGTPNQRVEMRL